MFYIDAGLLVGILYRLDYRQLTLAGVLVCCMDMNANLHQNGLFIGLTDETGETVVL